MSVFIWPPVSVSTLPPPDQATATNQTLQLNELTAIKNNTAQKQVSERLNFNYAGVSNAGYTQLIASTLQNTRSITWFESSGEPMVVAIGGAGAEVDLFVVPMGGFNGEIPIYIPAGSRVSIKQLTANAIAAGSILLANLFK